MSQARLLLTAVQFLTRCPVPAWVGHSPDQLNRAVRYFPLVGLGVGALGAGVFWVASAGLPPLAAAVLSIMATVLVTGAFHEDGLADTCDGLFGAFNRDDALRYMKDSRLGTFGVAGLCLVLSAKAALLQEPYAIIAAHAASRFMAVTLIAALPYVRESEQGAKAKPVAAGVGAVEIGIAGLCGLAPLLLLDRPVVALLGAALVTVGLARWFQRRLGGYTGDTLGATQQVTELAILGVSAWHAA